MKLQERLAQVRVALRQAEDRLTALIQEALEARAYEDVAAIAAISRRLHAIGEGGAGGIDSAAPQSWAPGSSSSREGTPPKAGSRGRRPKGSYPKFMRDGDRLIKVGWSKKDQAEYQHKAPKQAVDALMSALADVGPDEFSMETLLPILNEQGEEVPSYQAYLGLAWLRSWGAVRRENRGGYSVQPERLLESELLAQWQALPACEPEVADD